MLSTEMAKYAASHRHAQTQLNACIDEPSQFVSMFAAKKWSQFQNKWTLPAGWCTSVATVRGAQALARDGAACHAYRELCATQATRRLVGE